MEASLCACGEAPIDKRHGLHVICVSCREQVVKHVRRRFGPHRFAGRYAADVEDIVQECFRNLLMPSGLESFKPDPERKRADAFRAWLWCVVYYHCNNKTDYFRIHQEIGGYAFDKLPERHAPMTPEQAFARTRLRELNERAVAVVEPRWRVKGAKRGERFDVLLPLLYEKEADTRRARERLDIDDGHLRHLKWELAEDIRRDVRKQIREDLLLEPETDPEPEIDREIEALFQAAYPGEGVWPLFSNEPEPEPEPKDEQSEVTA